eukprot:UN21736
MNPRILYRGLGAALVNMLATDRAPIILVRLTSVVKWDSSLERRVYFEKHLGIVPPQTFSHHFSVTPFL